MKRFLLLITFISKFTYSQVGKPEHEPPLVINAYSEVLNLNQCKNEVTVSEPSLYKAGDTVLLIQMMGAVIDTSSTPAFGTIIDYKNAGNYEMNYIAFVSGNKIALRNKLVRSYDVPDGMVQLIRVPYIKVTDYVGEFTCMAWDGSKGGVLVLCSDTVDLKDDIDVSAKGFRRAVQDVSSSVACFENNYTYPATDQRAAFKGEGIASVPSGVSKGKGSPANGGGGGLSNNSGGGGGGNAGMGGFGGYQCDTCGNSPFDNRGIGAKALAYSSTANKIFMGGGGGGGHAANLSAPAPYEGTGGGIAIIIAENIKSSSLKILANGGEGITCNVADCNDGMYGGGAGGTVVLFVNNILDDVYVETKGGAGANVTSQVVPGGRAGPGGGGGGGMFFLNRSSMPANVNHNSSGGNNGTVYYDTQNPWGATSGTDGLSLLNLPNPWDTVLFKPNIDSVRFQDNINYCNSIRFTGFGFTNTYPVAFWHWDFGDGGTANTQNPVHNYNAVGNYNVKLVVTDINGCKDSISKTINTAGSMFADAGVDTVLCASGNKTFKLNGNGTGSYYYWTPSAVLDNNTLQNPTATIDTTTRFYLNITNGTGCSADDSVTITIKQGPIVKATKSNDLSCIKPFTRLQASGALNYTWFPAYALSNDSIANPIANPSITTTYYVHGKDTGICVGTDSVIVIADFRNHGIILPNSFTPNNDGLNDCFGLKHYRDIKDMDFMIYNRFGTVVFRTKDPAKCWDGNYKGKPAGPGSYVYYIKAKTVCGDVSIQDNLMLIR